jgi:hypothetical protein
MPSYKIEKEDDNFYTVRDVPIFATHEDRGFPCDAAWMAEAIQNHNNYSKTDFRPPIIIGHNKPGQAAEKEAYGFIDNLVLKGKQLYADFVRVPKAIKEKIIQNAYPNRSVEVLPKSKRIVALALLGGTTPHFALPQMVYGAADNETTLWYRSPEMSLSDEMKQEIKAAVTEALTSYSAQTAEKAPSVSVKSSAEIVQCFESGQIPELFEDSETGFVYSRAADGSYEQWPVWAVDRIAEMYEDPGVSTVPSAAGTVVTPQTDGTGSEDEYGDVDLDDEGGMLEEIEDDSATDQFASDVTAELYNLRHEVAQLSNANALLQAGRKAEQLKVYLLGQKKLGSPIQNVDEVVDYLMTQNDEQIKTYKRMIEGSPKVALDINLSASTGGRVTDPVKNYDLTADVAANKKTYDMLGVSEADLKYAKFIGGNR